MSDVDGGCGGGGCDGKKVACIDIVECPICLEVIENADVSAITVKCCNHKFHSICHAHCVAVKNECPLCRAYQCMRTPNDTPCVFGESGDTPAVVAGPESASHLVNIPTSPGIPRMIIHIHRVRGNVRRMIRRRASLICLGCAVAYCGMWFIG